MKVTLVGIDCATEEAKMGLARGSLSAEGRLCIERATLGSAGESAAATLASWIAEADHFVVALDAPLGWPQAMGTELSTHRAGQMLALPGHALFRRGTDRFLAENLRRSPPEVGADRVAHTAMAALQLLHRLRATTSLEVPMAWSPSDSGAIEVLPWATLRAHGLPVDAYRGQTGKARRLRGRIVDKIETLAESWVSRPLLVEDAHLLDAVVSVVAAADFARGHCYPPDDLGRCRQEGWIWVASSGQREMFG